MANEKCTCHMTSKKRLIYAEDVHEKIDREIAVCNAYSIRDELYYLKAKVENIDTVDAVEVVHGHWVLTANEEYSNFRWNVTAECSECHHSKVEIYAGFFSGFPKDIARGVVLDNAEKVKLDNYCPNCGAKMDGDGNG